MRLSGGTLWPIPITLDVTDAFAASLTSGQPIALRDPEGVMLAVLHVEDVWTPDKDRENTLVFGTTNREHVGVAATYQAHPVYVGGRVEAIRLPVHYDYRNLRKTPAQVRRIRGARAPPRRRVPDAQPDAPRAPGIDDARRQADRGPSPSASGDRRHQTG